MKHPLVHTRLATRLLFTLLSCACMHGAHAQGIVSAASVNRSDADLLVESDFPFVNTSEARSAAALRPPSFDGRVARLEHRFSFASGFSYEGSPLFGNLLLGSYLDLGYDLNFRIEDPNQQGYALTLDAALAGVMRVRGVLAEADLPAFRVEIDYGSGFVTLDGLATRERALDGYADPAANLHVLEQGRVSLGEFFGTRSFDVRVRTPGGMLHTGGLSDQEYRHHAYALFGMPTTSPRLPGGTYPAFDGSNAADHGHFLTVRADFNPSPVPEPEAWALWVAGLSALLLHGRWSSRPATRT